MIRFPHPSFTQVNPFGTARAQERIVTVGVPSKAHAYVREHHLPTMLRIRLLKVRLPKGEVEVLGTDLRDP